MSTSLAEKHVPKYVRDGIERTFLSFIAKRADKDGVCSNKTQKDRRQLYYLMFGVLWQHGYKLHKMESLQAKHLRFLMTHWHTEGVVAKTLHTWLAMINHALESMGKHNLVQRIHEYLPADEVRRTGIAKESKAWDAHGIEPVEVIKLASEMDERLGCMLAMQFFFGMRVKESIEFRPANAVVNGGKTIEIHEGTKGGKPRSIPVETEAQREIIEWVRSVAAKGNTKRLRWTDCSWKQAQSRFYYFVRKRLGISLKSVGVTPHGLRHGFIQGLYRRKTGLPTPVEGGALGRIDRETHHDTCITLAKQVGHNRTDIVGSYCGSYGHKLRIAPVKTTSKIVESAPINLITPCTWSLALFVCRPS